LPDLPPAVILDGMSAVTWLRSSAMQPPAHAIESILAAAVEMECEAERRQFVEQACVGDAEMRRRVEELIEDHFRAGDFLQFPAPALAATDEEPFRERPGTVIGPYKLLEEIGEGGFGVVFMAEQTQPVRRKVALKVLKPGMDTRQVVARFEAERQALALMDHPHIARVLDGGQTTSGRPYFVMDLVKGLPITAYCDQAQLTPRERLGLVVHLCQAVQHAHQKGIIHRDLKPSNVLVTLQDGAPLVKVIDFGIAKALGQQLTDKTLFTGFAQMVGTPLYMSPEQAALSNADVDTRSDVYSLGVLLYELLTGTTPVDRRRFRTAAFDEIRRIIREEDPPRPSTRLSTAEGLPTLAANRSMEPGKLTRLVRGELDWIVMKALEKDRNRRYDSAAGLAADVQRHLNDEPVQACPPSAWYRFRKFARRNKAGLAAAGFVLFVIALLGVVGGWVARDWESRKERTVAQAKAAWEDVVRLRREGKWPAALSVARRTEALLAGAGADPDLGRQFAGLCRDLEMAARLEEVRAHEPSDRTGRFDWTRLGPEFAQAFRDYGIDVEALAPGEAAELIRGRTIPEELVAALDDWAMLRWRTDRTGAQRLLEVARAADQDRARNRLREAFARGERAYLQKLATSDEIDHFPPSTILLLVSALAHAGATESAVEVLRKAQRQHPDDVWTNMALAEVLSVEPATRGEAIGFYRAALACRPASFAIHFILGHALQEQGKPEQAAELFRRATQLKPDSPWAHFLLGGALVRLDRLPEGLAEFRRAVQLQPRFDAPTPQGADGLRPIKRLVELDDRLPAVLRGEVQPRDAAERAEFALACRFRELEAASARLYGEAFALQPELAKEHRYHAAWAAVLAGIGKGKDAGGLSEPERAVLRGQARAWLRDELAAWREQLGKGPAEARAEVLLRVNCWLRDPELGCVRDPAPLGRLSAAEREEWERLWRDLRDLRSSARSADEG
jgi:serine/threonine protein kinase/tetratricopeptide (TPR) repeat protein